MALHLEGNWPLVGLKAHKRLNRTLFNQTEDRMQTLEGILFFSATDNTKNTQITELLPFGFFQKDVCTWLVCFIWFCLNFILFCLVLSVCAILFCLVLSVCAILFRLVLSVCAILFCLNVSAFALFLSHYTFEFLL